MRINITIDTEHDTLDEVMNTVEALFSASGYDTSDSGPAVTGNNLGATLNNGAPANTGAAPNIDAEGFPWDSRIHISPAKLTASGKWTKRRGLDKQVVLQVENELRAHAASTPATAPATPPAVTAPAAPPAPQQPATQPAVTAPAAPMAPLPPAAPPAPPVNSAYENLLKIIGDNLYHQETNPTGRITDEWVQKTLEAWGVPGGLIANCASIDPARVQSMADGIAKVLHG